MNPNDTPATMDLKMEYPELTSLEGALGPGRLKLEAIFPDRAGWGVKKNNRRRLKYLGLAAPLLQRMLWNMETIEYASIGTYVSTAEMFSGGVWAQFLNYNLILLTNYRLIFINTDTKGNPKQMFLHQVRFDRIKQIKIGLLGSFQLKLMDGKVIQYQGINKRDRVKLKQGLDRVLALAPPNYGPADGADPGAYENLCTNCFRAVPRDTYTCPYCQAGFRTPGQAALRSLILPGLGDLYLVPVAKWSNPSYHADGRGFSHADFGSGNKDEPPFSLSRG
jgi:hypothetical protein